MGGLNSLRKMRDAAEQISGGRVPDRHFVVSASGKFLAARPKCHRHDRRRHAIDGRSEWMLPRPKERFDGRGFVGAVEPGSLGDPLPNDLNMLRRKRIVLLRHSFVWIGARYQLE